MKQNERLTLVISSCDKFSDLWDAHFHFLRQNWGDRGIRTILLTDRETEKTVDGAEIFAAGEGLEYPQRIQRLLEYIDTEYVLITLDDYFPIRKIENERISRLLDIMDRENLDYVRMFSDPNSHKRFGKYDGLYEISLQINYAVNLYQGIWRKSFIEKTVGAVMTIWEYEVLLTPAARRANAKCVLSKGGEFEILDVIRKGKILHKARRFLRKQGIAFPEREVISYKEEARIRLFTRGKYLLPPSLAALVKKLLRKTGRTFYSDILESNLLEEEKACELR